MDILDVYISTNERALLLLIFMLTFVFAHIVVKKKTLRLLLLGRPLKKATLIIMFLLVAIHPVNFFTAHHVNFHLASTPRKQPLRGNHFMALHATSKALYCIKYIIFF